MMPTEKPSYFSFILVGDSTYGPDFVPGIDELREVLRKRIDRSDLVFGNLEAVSAYRSVSAAR